jgi:response regulator of citrate/malate metabolism
MFLENGFQDFLPKPINTVRLDEILRKWVAPKIKTAL